MNKQIISTKPKSGLSSLQKYLGGKKILHFGSLAGWPHTVTRVSRKMGVPSENVIHVYKDVLDLDRKLPYDQSIFQKTDPLYQKIFKTGRFLHNIPKKYGVVHYHSTTLLHREFHFLFEGPYLRVNKVPMVLSLGGGDARIDSEASQVNPYYYKTPNFFHDLRMKIRRASLSKNIAVCATDPEMALLAKDYFETIHLFRQPVELEGFPAFVPPLNKKKPLLLHVPTNPQIKGTKFIKSAVENLQKKGLRFEFRLVRQLSQKQFFDALKECDVYIDELRCGGHGMTAAEAMAMGKPTISYIREDLVNQYPKDCPIVNANPDTIEEILERLILDAELRHNIGKKSRLYAEKYHDAKIVMGEMFQIYSKLLKKSTN